MSEKEIDALAIWIQSLIDQKIEQAFGRDGIREWVRESELRQEIYALMGQANKEEKENDVTSKHGYISNDALNRMGGRLYREQ